MTDDQKWICELVYSRSKTRPIEHVIDQLQRTHGLKRDDILDALEAEETEELRKSICRKEK